MIFQMILVFSGIESDCESHESFESDCESHESFESNFDSPKCI